MSVRDPRHNLDHYMVLGYLRSAPLGKHTEYLGRRTRLPLQPPINPTREDGLIVELWRAIPKPKVREARKNAWISEATWRLIGKRFSECQDPAQDQYIMFSSVTRSTRD